MMKKLISKIPTFVLGTIVGVALTSATVVGAASYLKATVSNVKVVVDGKEAKLSDKPLNVNGRTYLPVRDTANVMGYNVTSATSSKIELNKASNTGTTPSDKTDKGSNASNNNGKGVYVKNLKETYSTDEKLDANKIRKDLDSGKLNINSQDEETGNSLLHYVIMEDNFNAYTAIKRNVLNPNIQNKEGRTPLHTAVIEKNSFYCGELLDMKADAKKKDANGLLPIDYAEKNSAIELSLKTYMW